MPFKSLQIIEPILRSLKEEGYTVPTPIQAQAIPIVLGGHDLLASAQTGTGKTAAFSIPILQHLAENRTFEKKRRLRSLILTPTRELAIQIAESLTAYGRHTGLTNTVIYGGVNQNKQTSALHRGVDILVATPGRLLDLMEQGFVKLNHVEIFVLDEADRMLDMSFVHDVKRILRELPTKRQSLFFSATMPKEIVKLSNEILNDPKKVEIKPEAATVDLIDQYVFFVDKHKKNALLLDVLQDDKIKTALVFTRTKRGADNVVGFLAKNDVNAEAIHSNKSQNFRQRALHNFKTQRTRVLVATDIAARGIDVDDLQYVINYEIPNIAETYVHRIGRTGRAGASGTAFSFCDNEEKSYIRDIQRLIDKKIEVIVDHPFPSTGIVERGPLHQPAELSKATHKAPAPKPGAIRNPPSKRGRRPARRRR